MILTCPNCGTQYMVKDDAIPTGGRQVRCASCKHSWHQDSDTVGDANFAAPPIAEPEAPLASEPIAAEPQPEADEQKSVAEATLMDPRSGPEAEERAYEEAVMEGEADAAPEPAAEAPAARMAPEGATYVGFPMGAQREQAAPEEDWREPPAQEAQDDEFSPFPAAGDAEPTRRKPVLAIVLLVLVIAAAAAFWFLAPDEWKARLGLVAAGASPLALVTTHMDRQKLESGNELLTVTGRVVNPTSKEQDVPPLQAQLKTRTGQVVYRWTIAPPARTLQPGASASFNSAEVNVPPGGEELTITLGPPNA
jgi:predicted Zn finger-like uncharacterized protein